MAEIASFELIEGKLPILLSMPHNGQEIPAPIAAQMQPSALSVPDTDWYLDRLYGFAKDLDITVIMPRYSRYVIDLNRSPENQPLYPGQHETELCPTSRFDREAIYHPGREPSSTEIQRRIQDYWQPYHQEISRQLMRMQRTAQHCMLFEAHSIRSQVPRFFDGTLPNLNFGTNDGSSCAPDLQTALVELDSAPYSKVVNARFKGGYITRHYADPAKGRHTLQLEIAQSCYMDEDHHCYDVDKAKTLQHYLQRLFLVMIEQLEEKNACR